MPRLLAGVFLLLFFRLGGLVVAEAEENWCADEGIFFADFAFQKAFPRPVQ